MKPVAYRVPIPGGAFMLFQFESEARHYANNTGREIEPLYLMNDTSEESAYYEELERGYAQDRI